MTDERFAAHPADAIATAAAHYNSADRLTHHFEQCVKSDDSMPSRYGWLQVVASEAIARVALLERQLAVQEQRAKSSLFHRTGNVRPIR